MANTEEKEPDDLRAAAAKIGLRYVDDSQPGLTRMRCGKGFRYLDEKGTTIRDKTLIARIKSLAIPPAYTEVWICRQANGHIQATGRDDRKRKQYRYHPSFRQAREASKFDRLTAFADALPDIRNRIDADMRKQGLPREKVLATVVHLLESTLIRIGNDDYARDNKSFGLATLRNRHVTVDGSELRFRFKGKSGKEWALSVRDRRVANIVKACQDLPGQELFQYLDNDGQRCDVTSSDINDYLREITGQDITAKDFRTWAGTVLAAIALNTFEGFESKTEAKRNLRDAIVTVAARLGNKPTICRKCYIHPALIDCYLEGGLLGQIKVVADVEPGESLHSLKLEEVTVLALLRNRLDPLAKAISEPGTTRRKSKRSVGKGGSSMRRKRAA